jgi:hypothetical protein
MHPAPIAQWRPVSVRIRGKSTGIEYALSDTDTLMQGVINGLAA